MAIVNNTMRLTGLFSGMDTDMIVKGMMVNHQLKLDKLTQNKTLAEWKKDQITDFNSQLRQFCDTYASMLGKGNMVAKSNYVTYTTEMAQNTSAFTVRGGSGAKTGAYSLRVDQAATAASTTSARVAGVQGGLTEAEQNQAIGAVLIDRADGYLNLTANDPIRLTLNGTEFTFKYGDSLKHIMDTVNKSGAGVTMNYSQITDSLTIASSQTGEASSLTIEDADNFLAHFGFGEIVQGQNAKVSVNGGEVMEYASNQFQLDGLEFDLRGATGGVTHEFSVTKSHQGAVDNIKAFVEDFNKLVKTLLDAHSEKKSYAHKPLPEMMKEGMSEKEIEDWNALSRQGIMYRDNKLGTLLNEMRGLLSQTLGGEGKLASIGIGVTGYKAGEAWQLEIDAEKLTKALESNADGVFNILGSTDKDSGGFAARLSKAMDAYVTSTKSADIQNLTRSISDYSKRIKEQEDKMYEASERYYKQYAQMEKAMSEMQSQTNQLMGLFGMGNNNNNG